MAWAGSICSESAAMAVIQEASASSKVCPCRQPWRCWSFNWSWTHCANPPLGTGGYSFIGAVKYWPVEPTPIAQEAGFLMPSTFHFPILRLKVTEGRRIDCQEARRLGGRRAPFPLAQLVENDSNDLWKGVQQLQHGRRPYRGPFRISRNSRMLRNHHDAPNRHQGCAPHSLQSKATPLA